MTVEELEDLAFHKAPMPDLKSQAQCKLFLCFRNLYDFAARTQMAPEQGRREKQQILDAYRIDKFLEEMQEETNDMWKKIEIAVSKYNKEPSVENADKIVEALYRAKRKDGSQ